MYSISVVINAISTFSYTIWKKNLSSSFYEFWQCWLFGYDRNIQRLFLVRSNTFSLENTIYIASIKSTSINWLFVVRASPHLQCSLSSKQPRNSPCLWPDIRELCGLGIVAWYDRSTLNVLKDNNKRYKEIFQYDMFF